jgi:L-ribulose-5-phosphate 3-epimerase
MLAPPAKWVFEPSFLVGTKRARRLEAGCVRSKSDVALRPARCILPPFRKPRLNPEVSALNLAKTPQGQKISAPRFFPPNGESSMKKTSLVLFLILALVAVPAGFGQTSAAPKARDAAQFQRGLSMKQVGIFLQCTGTKNPREALEAVKSLGLHMVQVSKLPDRFYTPEGAKEFQMLLRETGIHASAVVVVFDGENYQDQNTVRATVGYAPADLLQARLAYTRKCIDFASALGVKIVTFHVGFIPSNSSDPTYQRMLKGVSEVAAYGSKHNVAVALETGQETGEELLRFIQQIKETRVAVNFDTANLVLYGKDDPPHALRVLLSRVTSVHVKDGLLPASPSELGEEVRLGEGKAQVKECLRILQHANFRGPLVIENYVWRRGTDPLVELRTAKDFIQATLAELQEKGN